MSRSITATDAQRVRDPIDVIKPRGHQRDLQDSLIVEPDAAELAVMRWSDSRGVPRYLNDVVQHDAVLLRDRRLRVILLERRNE